MFAKSSLVGVMTVVVALATTVGCSRNGSLKAYKPPTNKQKLADAKTLKTLNGSEWVFDSATQSFSDEKLKEMGSTRKAGDNSFETEVSENGQNVFPKTLNFTSEKEVVVNQGAVDSVEASFTLANGRIELKAKNAKDSIKEATGGFVEIENGQMTWTTENPSAKSKMVFVFKRVR